MIYILKNIKHSGKQIVALAVFAVYNNIDEQKKPDSTVTIINTKPFKILTLAIVFAGGLLTSAPNSLAQSNLPGFVVPKQDSAPPMPMLNLDAQSFSNYETAFLKLRNKTLSDTLLLQYQISLLKILLERQAEIDNIASSFEKLGIKFNQPAPDKTICERLPENLLCMLFYPEMFDIDVEAYTNPQPAFDMSQFLPTNTPNATPTPNGAPAPSSAPEPEPEPEEITTPYLWSDIQCAISVCKVVLLDRRNPGKAYTVRSGQKMPDDSIVAEISYNGVKVNKKGEILTVEPAPANGILAGGEEVDAQEGAVRGIFESAGMANNAESNAAPTSNDSSTNTDNDGSLFDNVPEPAQSDEQFISDFAPAPADEPSSLGPTGLF